MMVSVVFVVIVAVVIFSTMLSWASLVQAQQEPTNPLEQIGQMLLNGDYPPGYVPPDPGVVFWYTDYSWMSDLE